MSRPPKQVPEPASLTAIPRRERRRVLIRSMASVLALDAFLLVLYAIVPIDDARGFAPIIMFALLILVFAGVVIWQVRAIVTARYPGVRAAAALAFAVPVYLVLCALSYLAIAKGDASSFTEPMNRADALYFTVTVFSTVGFGDITAVTTPARIAVTIQMILNLLVLGLVVKLLTAAAQYRMADTPSPLHPAGKESQKKSA